MRRHLLILLLSILSACTNSQPLAQPVNSGDPATLTGPVLERLDAPPYSYLRIKTAKGEVWAAIPPTISGSPTDGGL